MYIINMNYSNRGSWHFDQGMEIVTVLLLNITKGNWTNLVVGPSTTEFLLNTTERNSNIMSW